MITLSKKQMDALIEVCNVGMSKAAKQLSVLLSSSIDITIPKVSLHTTKQIQSPFNSKPGQLFVFVHQKLGATINGRALLIFNRENTQLLTKSVIGEAPKLTETEIRACQQEAMVEIGNIIISACVSAISSMLSRKISLSIPYYNENKSEKLLKEQIEETDPNIENIITISTHLETTNEDISGNLVLILTKKSIDRFLESLQRLLGK